LCDLLGVPAEDRHGFEEPSQRLDDIQGTTPEEKKEAVRDFYDFAWSVIEEKRARPGRDVISEVITKGARKEAELKGRVLPLFAAGHETTGRMFTTSVFFLLSERDRWEAIRVGRTSIEQTVEELLRWLNTVNTDMPRTATEDVEIE